MNIPRIVIATLSALLVFSGASVSHAKVCKTKRVVVNYCGSVIHGNYTVRAQTIARWNARVGGMYGSAWNDFRNANGVARCAPSRGKGKSCCKVSAYPCRRSRTLEPE